ncbi:MAG TPA: toxin-antitoxin system HicB family antitoxin [Candidatus Acidoferrales bacterium]
MRRSNFALRVPPTLLKEARKAAESEGVALNQLITLALAEKVSAMRTEEYFAQRARRADPVRVTRILDRVGSDNPPAEDDELPMESSAKELRKMRKKATQRTVANVRSDKRVPRP